jgi:hypothetical protein
MILFEFAYTDVEPPRSREYVNPAGLSDPFSGIHFGLTSGLLVLIPAVTTRKAHIISVTLKIIFVNFIALPSEPRIFCQRVSTTNLITGYSSQTA